MQASQGKPAGRARAKRTARPQARHPDRRRRLLRLALLAVLAGTIIGGGGVLGFVVRAYLHMPPLDSLQPRFMSTSFIYDKDGNQVVGLAGPENRVPVPLSQVAQVLKDAYIAHEDRFFFTHRGIVVRSILRSLWANLTGGRIQGGSTITQQLARSAFLTLDRTMTRKVQEAILAIRFERTYTKDEILELYLNQIHLGHGAYGVEAGSRLYFGKSASELNLAEAAMLVGLTKSPGNLTPLREANRERARQQQRIVLSQMEAQGFITAEEAEAARQTELVFQTLVARTEYPFPFFVDHVLDQLLNVYGLDPDLVYTGGLQIHTTLDPRIQAAAEAAVAEYSVHFPTTKDKDGQIERAEVGAVIMESDTGFLRAIVGGVDHQRHLQFNFATQARRQPGSAFKPIVVYTPAIDRGFSLASVVDDSPAVWFTETGEAWHPRNFDFIFRGWIDFRWAMERSVNVAAAKVLDWVGIRTAVEYAQRMGIDSLVTTGPVNDFTQSLSLGALTQGVSPLEMTRAFAVLGNRGVKVRPVAVLRVIDRAGKVLVDNVPVREAVLSEQTAWLMTELMTGVIHNRARGTGWRARIDGWTLAGKTGTSADNADAWFVGYSPKYSGAVWLGWPKARVAMDQQWGGLYPALIWRAAMVAAHEGLEPVGFEMPRDIIQVTVCRKSGRLPGPNCPDEDLVTEYFLRGTEPTEACTTHVAVRVCLDDPERAAGPACPPERTVWRTFIRRDPYVPWVRASGVALYPQDRDQEAPRGLCRVHHPEPPFVPDQVIEVTMARGQFSPRTITVPRGARVRLVLTAAERRYGLAIDGYAVGAVAAAGQTVHLDFLADRAGTFRMFCHVEVVDTSGDTPINLKPGMTGTLVVTP